MEETLAANLKAMLFKYWRRILSSTILLAISNGLLVINPLVLRKAILSLSRKEGSVWAWAATLVGIALISAVLKYSMRLGFFSIGRDAEKEMRQKLFNRIQSQSMSFFDRHGTGELLSRMTNDISTYRDILGFGIMFPLFFLTILIPALTALFMISKPLAFISSIPLLSIPLFHQGIKNKVFNFSLHVQKLLADLSNMAQEHYSGIRIIKSYAIEPLTTELFVKLCKKLTQINFKLVSLLGMVFPFFTFMTKLTTVLLVFISGFIILKAWSALSAADFIAFMWIQSYIFYPVLMLGWVLPIYSRGSAAYHRIVEVYKEPLEVQEGMKINLKITPGANIEIKQLSFKYPNSEQNSLNEITLSIQGGSFVGITGPIGSGKTTLFRLLDREYEIPPKKIFIDGYDIKDYTFAALRQAIVTVEQAPFLFSKSIADNVSFGKEEASAMEIERVAIFADLHETVLEFPEKYATMVGERGFTLSGGQKQRIALARAFLVDRSILLLDDIFSALDSRTEKKIFQALKTHFKGKTVLLISHRVSILEKMDRILFMQSGAIVEDGSPKELMQKQGHYAALAQLHYE